MHFTRFSHRRNATYNLNILNRVKCKLCFVDLNNRRTGKHATKPRALGLLGHSVLRNGEYFIWKLKSSSLSYTWGVKLTVPPIVRSQSRLETEALLSAVSLISSSIGYIWAR